ncbi:MAG: preprotein translocase subunit SecE [Anaerolineaceae bacterium]|nr:preprotein translocase subunit SecE [Anaerolineaceae bacterium]
MPNKKKKNEKKINVFTKWWRETVGELRKVTWPTPHEAFRLTKIVIIVMIAISAILGILDFSFTRLISWLLS